VRRGKFKPTDPQGYWVMTGKLGIRDYMEDLQRETGVRVGKPGQSYIDTRIVYECDLATAHNDGLEGIELHTFRNLGSCDPERGQTDQRIDFEWLLTRAFSSIAPDDIEDCADLALTLAKGDCTVNEFCRQQGWTITRYYKTFDLLKDAFYSAAEKERPAKQFHGSQHDAEKILKLYQEGYGATWIARLVGCSSSRADQIIQQAKRSNIPLPRSTKRSYGGSQGGAPAYAAVAH
jgi:hypothetical protein